MKPRIKIEILSPVEFEDVLAEIYLDDRYLGRISQKRGDDQRVIDFIDGTFTEIALTDLQACIERACARLDAMGPKSPDRRHPRT